MFKSDPDNILAVNDLGQIEITNSSKPSQKISFESLKINELPHQIASKIWDTINSGKKEIDVNM